MNCRAIGKLSSASSLQISLDGLSCTSTCAETGFASYVQAVTDLCHTVPACSRCLYKMTSLLCSESVSDQRLQEGSSVCSLSCTLMAEK